MARQRGGLAGLYDRNKGVIQAAAPFLAGAVGGPLAGAAVGAAMKGLDREGKSGIGLDLGKAAMGGVAGYGAGAMGKSAAGALKGRLAGLFSGAQGGGGASLPPVNMASKIGMTPGTVPHSEQAVDFLLNRGVSPVSSASLSAAGAPASFTKAATEGATRGKSLMSRAESFAKEYPKAIGEAAKLAMAAAGPDNEGRALALRERQYEDEQAAAGRRAEIAAQLLTGTPQMLSGMPQTSILPNKSMKAGDYLPSTTAMGESFPDDPRVIQAMERGHIYMASGYGGSPNARAAARRAQEMGASYRYPR